MWPDGCHVVVHTFMSEGNSSFFTRPVAAAMFPIAPVVLSATVESHTNSMYSHTHTHTGNMIPTDSADEKHAHDLSPLYLLAHNYHLHFAPATHKPSLFTSMNYQLDVF